MEDVVNDFDKEFDNMSAGEKLYADALAHLLDRDTIDYVDFLEEDNENLSIAAESGESYGDD